MLGGVSLTDDLNQAFQPWLDSLNGDEIDALERYQGSAHEPLNELHRFFDEVIDRLAEEELEELLILTEALDSAIEKGAMPFDLTLYRGIKNFERTFEKTPLDVLPGHPFHDKAFFSTSIHEHRARKFIDDYEEGCVIVLHVPEGHPAAWLHSVGSGYYAGQNEILLPRDIDLEITTTRIDEGIIYVVGEIT